MDGGSTSIKALQNIFIVLPASHMTESLIWAFSIIWCQLSMISIWYFDLFLWYYLANWNQNVHEFIYKVPYKNISFFYDLSSKMATRVHSQHIQVQMIYNLVQIMFVSPFYWYRWFNLQLTKTWLSLTILLSYWLNFKRKPFHWKLQVQMLFFLFFFYLSTINGVYGFLILQNKIMAAMGNSCFWLAENFNIVCQATVLYNMFYSSNDVCEIPYKDSPFNLVLIQYKRLLNIIYDTEINNSLASFYLWHKNKHLPHILLRNIPCIKL